MKLTHLVQQLKACSSPNTNINLRVVHQVWKCFSNIDPENGDAITSAMVAALILYDEESFAELLNETERSQLNALAKKAFDRFNHITNPSNKVGKILAAALKEPS